MSGDPTDYGGLPDSYFRSLCAAEDVAGSIVDQILLEGGTLLWQKYLERKAFGYATEAVVGAAVASLQMCFVAHDKGEVNATESDWVLEEEPEPAPVDNWARMHVPLRRAGVIGDAASGAANSNRIRTTISRNQQQNARSRNSDPRPRAAMPTTTLRTKPVAESRFVPFVDEHRIDEEEEFFREAKTQEETKRKERERRTREGERAKEEDRKQIAIRHEEMRIKPHTFDHEGNIIWVDEVKSDRLPKVQETANFLIKRETKAARSGGLEDALRSTMNTTTKTEAQPGKDANSTGAKGSRRSPHRGRGSNKVPKVIEPEYSDSFSKLLHGQPPILETMVVQAGVTLEALGKKKAGSHGLDDRGTMSRREYNRMAERDVAADYRGSLSGPATAGVAPGEDGSAAGLDLAEGNSATGSLPALRTARNSNAMGRTGSTRALGAGQGSPMQRAPQAPPPGLRDIGKKFQALGATAFQHAPRYHAPQLGGPSGYGSAQPPLGATMGHGLVRHGSLKEEYFFPPPPVPGVPMAGLQKSVSDASLISGRRGAGRGGGTTPGREGGTPKGASSKGSLKENSRDTTDADSVGEIGNQGVLRAENMSPAYRNFRKALVPEPGTVGPISAGFAASSRFQT